MATPGAARTDGVALQRDQETQIVLEFEPEVPVELDGATFLTTLKSAPGIFAWSWRVHVRALGSVA